MESTPVHAAQPLSTLQPHAQLVAKLGPATEAAVRSLAAAIAPSQLQLGFQPAGDDAALWTALHSGLKGWSDAGAAEALKELTRVALEGRRPDLVGLGLWLTAHRDAPKAVTACLEAEPPDGFRILQLLSTAGSQKLVFLANWSLAQQAVVLKRFINAGDPAIARELQANPLAIEHANIIQTQIFHNRRGEPFLVERRLHEVLSDAWRARGTHEAANLMRDMSSALAFLHGKLLVHGDVKPDNIGMEHGRYILLDFGICRRADAFGPEAYATGSLRTRAPELLLSEGRHSTASDIWALGATVFNAMLGRFPLFDKNEQPPRVWAADDRTAFERELARRARDEWDARLEIARLPDAIAPVVASALQRDPIKRPAAKDLLALASDELAAFLRPDAGLDNMFSPSDQLAQLEAYLPSRDLLELMPESQRRELRALVQSLQGHKGFTEEQAGSLGKLLAKVGGDA